MSTEDVKIIEEYLNMAENEGMDYTEGRSALARLAADAEKWQRIRPCLLSLADGILALYPEPAQSPAPAEKCEWTQHGETWDTGCGKTGKRFVVPEPVRDNCPYCGKAISVKEQA